MKEIRKCKYQKCGKEFEVKGENWNRLYCSRECRRKNDYNLKRELILQKKQERYEANREKYLERAKYFRSLKGNNLKTDRIMSDVECAYVAGFWDGEGTIGIGKNYTSPYAGGMSYHSRFEVSNTNIEVINKVRDMLGNGRIGKEKRENNKHKTLYRLKLTPNQVRHVLPQIKEYLIIKKEHALVLLEYLKIIKDNNYRNYTPPLLERLTFLYNRAKLLNFRGKVTYLPTI